MSVLDVGKDLPINDSNSHELHERNPSTTSTPPDQQPNTLQFQRQLKKQENGKNSANLTIEFRSPIQESDNGVDEDDEPTTPTSSDQKIPVTTTCPPAPRKPKTVPMSSNKRKTRSFQRISVDLRVMIDALFDPAGIVTVPDILTGDLDAGDHAKKVKKTNLTNTGA